MARTREQAERMGAPRALALCQNFGGALDFQAGRWTAAERSLRDAVARYREVGSAAGESLSLQRLGVLLTARGAIDEAYDALSEGLVVAERAAMRSHCLTRLHASLIRNRLAARDRAGIEVSLREGLEVARRHGSCVTCSALLLPELVRAQIELGQLDDAWQGYLKLQEIAAAFESHVWDAMAAQCYGRVMLAQGELEEALGALVRAADAYEAADQPYEVARCVALQAACLKAQGCARAAETADRARRLFDELGASGIE